MSLTRGRPKRLPIPADIDEFGQCVCFTPRGDGLRCGGIGVGVRAGAGTGEGAAPAGALCSLHMRRVEADPVLRLLYDCVGVYDALTDADDIYRMCVKFWSRDPSVSDRYALLKEAILSVFSANRLRQIAEERGIPRRPAATTKFLVTDRLLEDFYRIWRFTQGPGAMKGLVTVQRRWRARRAERVVALRGPWPDVGAQNDTDPFTLDDLSEIPREEVFSYRDSHGSVYAFRAKELAHYAFNDVDTKGPPANPYTRELIPEADVDRLQQMVTGNLTGAAVAAWVAANEDLETLWQTGRDAYTYTLYFFERDGFYCDVDLFLRLTPDDIVRIFHFFHENTRHAVQNQDIMRLDACYEAVAGSMERPEMMQFAFCRELLVLIRGNRHDKFYLICNLFMSMAVISRRIARSLPQWVFLGAAATQRPR